MRHSDVTIHIVTATALDACRKTLSFVLNTREGAHLILTSNGNPEAAEYFESIAKGRDNVTVIINGRNEGFIKTSNWAFSLCETDFFCILNDDAIPDPEWLDKMKAALSPELVAIAGPCERWLDHNFVGRQWSMGMPMRPDFMEGVCLMVKCAVFHKHHEMFFWSELSIAYTEDADQSLRMRKLGYDIAKADFTIQHKSGTTTRTVPELHDTMRENFGKCIEKWGEYLKTRKFE